MIISFAVLMLHGVLDGGRRHFHHHHRGSVNGDIVPFCDDITHEQRVIGARLKGSSADD